MPISQKTIKILWADAAGRCAFTDCRERLCISGAGEFASYTIGEMAHISGERLGSNRHEVSQTPDQRDDYANLILLCPTHHTLIDQKETEGVYTVEELYRMKKNHEAYICSRLDMATLATKADAVRQIAPMLADSHEAWRRFGPFSDIATKNPHSNSAYAVWTSERLSTIIPNNRRISAILTAGRGHFSQVEQQAIAAFLVHARSYERWVCNEVSYEAVGRFPLEFNAMIEGCANAG